MFFLLKVVIKHALPTLEAYLLLAQCSRVLLLFLQFDGSIQLSSSAVESCWIMPLESLILDSEIDFHRKWSFSQLQRHF